jgi:hypothetical protein
MSFLEGLTGFRAYPAVQLLLFLMYHRLLHINISRNHNMWGMSGILAHPAIPVLFFLMYNRSLVAYQYI